MTIDLKSARSFFIKDAMKHGVHAALILNELKTHKVLCLSQFKNIYSYLDEYHACRAMDYLIAKYIVKELYIDGHPFFILNKRS